MKTAFFYYHLLRTSMKASISLRWNFIFEMFLMMFNNLIFFSMWWVFFLQFNDIGGWQFQDMAALMAIGAGAPRFTLILRLPFRKMNSGDPYRNAHRSGVTVGRILAAIGISPVTVEVNPCAAAPTPPNNMLVIIGILNIPQMNAPVSMIRVPRIASQ